MAFIREGKSDWVSYTLFPGYGFEWFWIESEPIAVYNTVGFLISTRY